MRVIAGTAKRLQLQTVDSLYTRPTTDRIKETLFNMINPYLYNCRFLDLFAGSGQVGIEALSRGSKDAVFIENNRDAIVCIKKNLYTTKLEDKAEIISSDVLLGLRRLEGASQFDIVFMDPPYHKEEEKQVLNYLQDSHLISTDTLIIIEAALDTPVDYIEDMNFVIKKIKEYKTNKHIFIEYNDQRLL